MDLIQVLLVGLALFTAEVTADSVAATSVPTPAAPVVHYGVAELQGRRPSMEDRYAVLTANITVGSRSAAGAGGAVPWRLFGVYDGHAGTRAAEFATEHLLPTMLHELSSCTVEVMRAYANSSDKEQSRAEPKTRTVLAFPGPTLPSARPPCPAHEEEVAAAMMRSFELVDGDFAKQYSGAVPDGTTALVMALAHRHVYVANAGDCHAVLVRDPSNHSGFADHVQPLSSGSAALLAPSAAKDTDVALRKGPATRGGNQALARERARKRTRKRARCQQRPLPVDGTGVAVDTCLIDAEYLPDDPDGTAVGAAVALTVDHHPDRPDERARIEARGGYVTKSGVWRVNGQLAVSRAIGDIPLKPFVIPNPDVTHVGLRGDELGILLASDGFFDRFSDEEAVAAIHRLLKLGADPSSVARWLAHAAYERNSMDNITVLYVSLVDYLRATKTTHDT